MTKSREFYNMSRIAKGRICSNAEIKDVLQEYRKRTEKVRANMDWEDYLNLIDIVTYVNTNSGIDLAFKVGYLAGQKDIKDKIEDFLKGGVVK